MVYTLFDFRSEALGGLESRNIVLGNRDRRVFRYVAGYFLSALLDDEATYEKKSHAVNHYGDGKACKRIIAALNGENPTPYGK